MWTGKGIIVLALERHPPSGDAALAGSLHRRLRLGERAIEGVIFLNGLLAILVLLGVLALLLREGLPVFTYSSPGEFFPDIFFSYRILIEPFYFYIHLEKPMP